MGVMPLSGFGGQEIESVCAVVKHQSPALEWGHRHEGQWSPTNAIHVKVIH